MALKDVTASPTDQSVVGSTPIQVRKSNAQELMDLLNTCWDVDFDISSDAEKFQPSYLFIDASGRHYTRICGPMGLKCTAKQLKNGSYYHDMRHQRWLSSPLHSFGHTGERALCLLKPLLRYMR